MAAAPDLTLEEAAEFLGLSVPDFKQKLKLDVRFKRLEAAKKRDGSSFRYPLAILKEVARELGAGSSDENPIPDFNKSEPPAELQTSDFQVPNYDEPLNLGATDVQDDVFSLSEETPVTPSKPKSGSDSDIRLDAGSASGRPTDDSSSVPTEEITLDLGSGPGSAVIKGGSSAKLTAPKSSTKLGSESGKSLSKPGAGSGDSSEFELSLDSDSDDFELKLNTDTNDEVELGVLPGSKDSGSSGRRASESGILMRKPADSGISLEKSKPAEKPTGKIQPDDSDSDVDFELTLDSASAVSGTKLGGPKSNKITTDDSESEFELNLESSDGSLEAAALQSELVEEADKSSGDIFETDFEIPAMEDADAPTAGSTAQVEESDFDVSLDDSTSVEEGQGEVELLLEEEEESPAKPRKKAAAVDTDVDLAEVEDEDSAVGALKGVQIVEEEEEEEEMVAGATPPAPWGPVPALFLLPSLFLVIMAGLMSYELLQTMWGYQQPDKVTAPLLREVASVLDMELKDQ